ncbi:MAG: TadE family protein [Gemmatimonadetes bacterium]|nr:TadE family protein [Gemmatimonadota bacterium]
MPRLGCLAFRRDEDGAVAVEFALVVPVFLLMVFGIVDLGRAYYTVNNLVSAAREGARYASVLPDPTAIADSVRLVVANTGNGLGAGAIPSSLVDVAVDRTLNTVTVTVRNYPFKLITPFAGTIGRSTILMSKSATFHWEHS